MPNKVVFLHGSPGRASIWRSLIAQAPPDTVCTAFDLIEHGASPDAPAATTDDVVDDVVRRVRSLGDGIVLVGHSFGAWAAGRALPALGGSVHRFVAIAGVPGIDEAIASRSAGFAAALEAGQLPLDAAATIAADLWLPTVGRRPEDVAEITDLIRSDTAARLARVLRRQTELADPARWVMPYDVPSISIHNTGDRGAPVALGRQLAALGTRSEWIELDGDGHYAQWSHPLAVARAVFRS